jgi:hypothetical protein
MRIPESTQIHKPVANSLDFLEATCAPVTCPVMAGEDTTSGARYSYVQPTPQAYQPFVATSGQRIYQGTMTYTCAAGLTQKCLTIPEHLCDEGVVQIGKLRCTYTPWDTTSAEGIWEWADATPAHEEAGLPTGNCQAATPDQLRDIQAA